MRAIELPYFQNHIPPAAIVDDGSFTILANVDTLGFSFIRFIAILGASDIAMAALKVQESDDNSSFADITGAAPATMPSATDDNKVVVIDIKMEGNRKRYLKLIATAGNGSAGTYLTCLVEKWKTQQNLHTAAGANLLAHVNS